MRTRRNPRRAEAQPADLLGSWQVFAAVATAILGLGAYVYVLGGIVVWLQAVGARLQADDVVAVVENRVLVGVGIRTLFVELGLVVLVAILIPVVQAAAKGLEDHGPKDRVVNRVGEFSDLSLAVILRAALAGMVVAALLGRDHIGGSGARLIASAVTAIAWATAELLLRTFTRFFEPGHVNWWRGGRGLFSAAQIVLILAILVFAWTEMAAPLGVAVTVAMILLFLVDHFPPSSGPPRSRRRRRALAVVTAVVALNVIIITYMATPPVTYDRAEVALSNGNTQVGAYLGRTSDGVYLAICAPVPHHPDHSERARITVIPTEKVEGLELGGPVYGFDVGHRPTLLALTWHLVSGGNLGKSDDGVELDLRKERPVCGKTAGA